MPSVYDQVFTALADLFSTGVVRLHLAQLEAFDHTPSPHWANYKYSSDAIFANIDGRDVICGEGFGSCFEYFKLESAAPMAVVDLMAALLSYRMEVLEQDELIYMANPDANLPISIPEEVAFVFATTLKNILATEKCKLVRFACIQVRGNEVLCCINPLLDMSGRVRCLDLLQAPSAHVSQISNWQSLSSFHELSIRVDARRTNYATANGQQQLRNIGLLAEIDCLTITGLPDELMEMLAAELRNSVRILQIEHCHSRYPKVPVPSVRILTLSASPEDEQQLHADLQGARETCPNALVWHFGCDWNLMKLLCIENGNVCDMYGSVVELYARFGGHSYPFQSFFWLTTAIEMMLVEQMRPVIRALLKAVILVLDQ
eukprot:TRINITY_DN11659_c0_g1_i1.p1 TRINITY_DN11659_c0_g1~~TRINITY_DN11659_c0_g1_i1.p1  ORF type:complete len:374 (+),score=37.52 TRINITY_DN11659_c0_g1_i1:2402-3523(+)